MSTLYLENDWLRQVDETVTHGDAYRSASRKDYSRLLHSACWRRMQGKTQLFPGMDSEFFRNRLTHSLEVAQIAKSIALKLNNEKCLVGADGDVWEIDLDLIEFAGLAHDLGHPPFGHEGEHALDQLMLKDGGFEGNAQTLRILTTLEEKIRAESENGSEFSVGLNLTLRSLAAVLKYDEEIPLERKGAKLKKGYYTEEADFVAAIKLLVSQVELPVTAKFKTLECTIMDVADDIAYSTYDFEDGMKGGFRTPLDLISPPKEILAKVLSSTNSNLEKEGISPITEADAERILAELVAYSGLYDHLPVPKSGVQSVQETVVTAKAILEAAQATAQISLFRTRFTSALISQFVDSIKVEVNQENPPLSRAYLENDVRIQVELLKHLNYETVIRSHRLRVVAHRGREIVSSIFKAILENPDILPDQHLKLYLSLPDGSSDRMRCVCDYVACLTDREAVDLYARLYSETYTSIYRPLA